MIMIHVITLAKLARSALKTAQREGKEFIFLFKVERFFFFNGGTYFQFFPISEFYLAYYEISVAEENTVLKIFCDGNFFTSINYVFYFNCGLS